MRKKCALLLLLMVSWQPRLVSAAEGEDPASYTILDASFDAHIDSFAAGSAFAVGVFLWRRERVENLEVIQNIEQNRIRLQNLRKIAQKADALGTPDSPVLLRIIGMQRPPNDRLQTVQHEVRLRSNELVAKLDSLQNEGVRINEIQAINPRTILRRGLGAFSAFAAAMSFYRLANAIGLGAIAHVHANPTICYFPELGQIDPKNACQRDWVRSVLTGQRFEPRLPERPLGPAHSAPAAAVPGR